MKETNDKRNLLTSISSIHPGIGYLVYFNKGNMVNMGTVSLIKLKINKDIIE